MAVDERRTCVAFMTKTQHYRKITKPLLERKRRARMNLYIDELKDLIVDTMEAQGEHVAKWEKADILEMTVNYLKMQRLNNIKENTTTTNLVQSSQSSPPPSVNGGTINLEKFRAGYTQAAYDVSKIFATLPGLDLKFSTRLMQHLGGRLKDIPQTSDDSTVSSSTSAAPIQQAMPSNTYTHYQRHEPQVKNEVVWRPW